MKLIIEQKIKLILNGLKGLSPEVEEICAIGIVSMDNWEWPQGIALFAIYNQYKLTGDKELLGYLQDWFDKQIAKGLPGKNVNTMCPMLTLTYIYEETKDEKYMPLLQEWVEFAMNGIPRTEEMGLQHTTSDIPNEGQLWDDTLYMTVLYMTRMGVLLNDKNLIDESIRQFMVHIKYLTDVKTGLLYHGWSFVGNHHFGEVRWARGNSWYTAGLVDYLEMTEINEGVKKFLLTTLEMQVRKLSELQDASGLWHTVLDDPTSYLETSASCAFAYGILKSIRMGYIDERYKEIGIKALNAVLKLIDEEGTVQGVSYGTPVFNSIEEYKNVPICPMPYGQSMALMLLVEAKNIL